MNTFTLLPAALLVGLAAGGVLGHQVGARQRVAVQARLDDLNHTLDTQARAYQLARTQLAASAADIEAQARQAQDRLQATYQAQKQRLQDGNAQAPQRIAALQRRVGAIDREREAIRQASASVPGGDATATATARLGALDAERSADAAQLTALACLQAAVPAEQLASLRSD